MTTRLCFIRLNNLFLGIHLFETCHVTEFEYDNQHRLIAEIQDGKRLEISLDEYGRQVGLQLPNGKLNDPNAPQSAVKISQVFNRYGELEAFQVNAHSPLNFRYDKLGRQTEKRSQAGFLLAERFTPSGLLQAQGGGYDNDLTQQQLNHYEPWVQFLISGTQISRKWEYDAAFNLTATNDRAWGRTVYQSNRNGQITAVLNSRTGSELYGYDSPEQSIQESAHQYADTSKSGLLA